MLLLVLLVVYGGFEVLAQAAIRSSRILNRTDRELKEAVLVRRSAGGRKNLLVVGNSLLDEDLEFSQLQAQAAAIGWDTHRLVVEQTTYFDWHFGIRRLVEQGGNPDAIMLMLSPDQLVSGSVLNTTFAHYLMRTQDLPAVVGVTGIHPTEGSGFLLARYDAFYGLRQELRKNLLRLCIPNVADLTRLMAPAGSPAPNPLAESLVEQRMREQRRELEAQDIRFALVIPPVPVHKPVEDDAAKGALQAGVTLLMPKRSGEFPVSAFRDGFHMNPAGAEVYTKFLAPDVIAWLKSGK